MAEVILGVGTSHSPMVSTPLEHFWGHVERDRRNPTIPDFEALVREKASVMRPELTPEKIKARHESVQTAVARLSDVLTEAAPDVLIVIGDDQEEWFTRDNIPAMCIYWG